MLSGISKPITDLQGLRRMHFIFAGPCEIKPHHRIPLTHDAYSHTPSSSRTLCHQHATSRRPQCHVTRAVEAPSRAAAINPPATGELAAAKEALLNSILGTDRGLRVGSYMRRVIEDQQVALERLGGEAISFDLLAGKWKLLYTTAIDVLPILEAEYRLAVPFGPTIVRIGNIYQRFSSPDEGILENIVEFGLPFLEDHKGATFTVGARYEVRSSQRIAVTFQEARLSDVRINETCEALLAPALLPRTSLQHQLLLAIKEFQVRIPFRSAQQVASAVAGNRSVSAGYQLTYLDDTMLVGRATQLRGTFIFSRETESEK